MSDERWLPVVGWEGRYEVSDHGRVRSLPHVAPGRRNGDERVLMPFRGRILRGWDDGGYRGVGLSDGPKTSTRLIHRLVLEAFVGPCPPGLEACHNDGNASNNHVSNLRWDDRSANTYDRVRHGTHHSARKTHCKHGHEFTPENTYRVPTGGRACRRCLQIRKAKYRAEKKATA